MTEPIELPPRSEERSADTDSAAVAVFNAGSVKLESGAVMDDAQVVYATHGELNHAADNVVVIPTFYGGSHIDNEYLIGTDRAVDPRQYFVVVPNMLGNGVSSSPSNRDAHPPSEYPLVTIRDNVALQARLLREVFGIESVELVVGFSMGGQQAYQWAVQFPSLVRRIAVVCGSARTTPHTYVFLEGVKAALLADASFAGGGYTEPPQTGLRAMARAWAGWTPSQAWYRAELYRAQGYETIEQYLVESWEAQFLNLDANDLLAMIATWQQHDVSSGEKHRGNFQAALNSITADTLLLPCRTDLYFPPEDSEFEARWLNNARIAMIESIWGHDAGGGANAADLEFLTRQIRSHLCKEPA